MTTQQPPAPSSAPVVAPVQDECHRQTRTELLTFFRGAHRSAPARRPGSRGADVVRSQRSCRLWQPRAVPAPALLRLRLRRASAGDLDQAGPAPSRRAPAPSLPSLLRDPTLPASPTPSPLGRPLPPLLCGGSEWAPAALALGGWVAPSPERPRHHQATSACKSVRWWFVAGRGRGGRRAGGFRGRGWLGFGYKRCSRKWVVFKCHSHAFRFLCNVCGFLLKHSIF